MNVDYNGCKTKIRKFDIALYCIQGIFCPRFIIAIFVQWGEGEFKNLPNELCYKDFEAKLKCTNSQK